MKPLRFACSAAMIAILFLLLPAGLLAAQNPDSAAISTLLSQVKSHAANAENDAAELESFTRSSVSWQSHAQQLRTIKVHVNNLIRDSNELSSLRGEGSPWQQEAIDRITELLPVMADHLNATIKHLSDNPGRVNMPTYREYARTNQTLIQRAHALIADFVDYEEAKSKSEALEKQLQLASSADNPQP